VIKRVPHSCENCQGINLIPLGLGTEQVEKTFKKIFPKARVGRFDRGVIKNRKDLERILGEISRKEVDIIIGTQMITKGHDFPDISLVGILVADSSLNVPDFRALERTYQVLTQVSGRAGRGDDTSRVIVQTVNPLHPIFEYVQTQNSESFYREELQTRKQHVFPPFCRLAMIRFQHSNPKKVEEFAFKLSQQIRMNFTDQIEILGPSEAPLSKLKGLYRWHFLIKSGTVKTLKKVIQSINEIVLLEKSSVQVSVDVDPVSTV
jgi:primosomal protein N' (replication factor Y)